MTHANFLANAVLPFVQKQENVMHVYIEKKFTSVFLKNTMQFAQLKKENVEIIKIYLLNIQQMIFNFLLNDD